MLDWSGLLGLLGSFSVGLLLFLLARLSRRMGQVNRDKHYHIGLYVAAALVWAGTLARGLNLQAGSVALSNLHQNVLWLILYNGLPAVGTTLGLFIAWRYWSWLLADRD